MLRDRQWPDAGVIGILIAHLGAFGSCELKIKPTVCLSSIQLLSNHQDLLTYNISFKNK